MAQINYIDTNGLDFIKKINGTNVSSISIDNCFSDRYTQYKIILRLFKNSANNRNINMYMRANGSNNTSTNYHYQYIYAESTTRAGSRSTASAFINVAYGVANANENSISIIEILNPYQSTYTSLIHSRGYLTSGSSIGLDTVAQGMTVTTSYDGFTVYPTAETITGDIYVYGYVNS